MAVLNIPGTAWLDRGVNALRMSVVILALAFLGDCSLFAQSSIVPKEYQVKAAFLFNFAQFVEWPAAAFTNEASPLCIGVLGENPFGSALEDITRGETAQNRKLIIRQASRVQDLNGCQLIFVAKSENVHTAEIISDLDSRPVLTVSETDGFTKRGGVINFYREGGKVRFEINPAAAKQRGLKLSSELLDLGKIIHSEDTRDNK